MNTIRETICGSDCRRNTPLGYLTKIIFLIVMQSSVTTAFGQQSTRFDQYELHHSIVYTTFLSPEVAAEYGIARGKDKAMLTLSVRDVDTGETSGRPMTIAGRTWDLISGSEMEFQEIREGGATYYIVPFEFLDREHRFFEFTFTPAGSTRSYQHKFKRQLWRQDDP